MKSIPRDIPKKYKPIGAPVTWFGGKARFASRITELFPAHKTFVDVFGGSGSVLLAKPPAPSVDVYNDLDGQLVNLFQVIRSPSLNAQLIRSLELTLYSRAEFDLAKSACLDPVESARRFFVRQRMSHGGFGDHWSFCRENIQAGMPSVVRRFQAGVERLPAIHQRIKNVQIEQDDWSKIIDRFDAPSTLFYMDPPYVPSTRIGGAYTHELAIDDHLKMVKRLLSIKGMVVLSGYDHGAYAPLEKSNWIRQDFETTAYTSAKAQRTRRTECLWSNPACVQARQNSSIARENETDSCDSPINRMREGAYITHEIRTQSTQAKLTQAIHEIRMSGQKVRVGDVAARCQISREQVSRKYKHLFATVK